MFNFEYVIAGWDRSLKKIKRSIPKIRKFKKETLAQVFSCEFCEISKDIFSYRTPPVAASGNYLFKVTRH